MRERGSRDDAAELDAGVAGEVPPAPPTPIDWWKLSGSERADVLRELSPWVEKFVFYWELSDSVVPPCWFRHNPLVQELLGVFQYRNQQQFADGMGAPPGAANEFNMNLASYIIPRLRAHVTSLGCNGRTHEESRIRPWVVDGTAENAAYRVGVEDYTHSHSALVEGEE